MSANPSTLTTAPDASAATSLLTPTRCRWLLLVLLAAGVVARLLYLHSPDALDLAPDEAQYWTWAKRLDWSYYSKPGMVAWLIAASTAVFGDTMPAVRYPALLLGVGTLLLTYDLTRRLFGSDRLALGAVGLCHIVPMFIAGSMLMTIDPPFVFFWALATYFVALGLVEQRRWAFVAAGLATGLSFLSKYPALLFLPGALAAMALDRTWRRHLLTPWPWVMCGLALLLTLPVVLWNLQQGWVSAQHVRADTMSGFRPLEPLSFLAGTIGAVNPMLFAIFAAAVVWALRSPVTSDPAKRSPLHADPEHARRLRLLVWTVLPYAALVTASAFFTNTQINWSAPVWFAVIIVSAAFLASRRRDPAAWRRWRGLLYGSIAVAAVVMPLAHHMRLLYPAFELIQTRLLGWEEVHVRRWDPTARLQGWKQLAAELDRIRRERLGPDAFILTQNRTDASALAFYTPGHPPTYVMGPFIADPQRRGRKSQYDLWPDRSLERGRTQLTGRDAIYVGPPWPDLAEAFARVETVEPIRVTVRSFGREYLLTTRTVLLLRDFRGFPRPDDGAVRH
ncbi:MAG: glycosyltransferase family 39 protein [Tepidisphaerales bacterium]